MFLTNLMIKSPNYSNRELAGSALWNIFHVLFLSRFPQAVFRQ
ncbi:hypothetical protein MuYL_4061 [Mucilaginibacter xinganensis]|uniref:Uncharacterized protein n=1 Tax=Mucilaginibacter xinganensis TaxID=1234841 RepID=A0A223P1H8_9SPHI|nr:hypothetical protein MuYL_4061 [Mucilaginibacter xinganensis]